MNDMDRGDLLLEALGEAVAHIRRVGGYMAPEQQDDLRRWQAVLLEHGRGTKP